jgi:hypothetical protein
MVERRGEQLRAGDVLGVRIVGRESFTKNSQEKETGNNEETEQVEPVADQKSPQIPPKLTRSPIFLGRAKVPNPVCRTLSIRGARRGNPLTG